MALLVRPSLPLPSLKPLNPTPTPRLLRVRAASVDAGATPSSDSAGGTGAAASTRGDRFLDSRVVADAWKASMEDERRRRKQRRVRKQAAAAVAVARQVPCCYGCGAPLQSVEAEAPGFVDADTYELKKKHRQLKTILCGRCKLLSHGHMVTAVGGHGGYPGGKQFVSAEELREKLSHLRHEKALIVKLVDIVDFNGSFLARVRDLAGANPIILVVTKVDLLPRETDFNCIGDWVVDAVMKKKLNVLSVHLTSSKSFVGLAGVMSEIQKEKKGRDVYILGAANVGKSAFISALLRMMADKDPVAAAAQKYKPIQSAVPGTTLGPIQIEAFLGGGRMYDTPGVHLHHRQAAVIHSDDLSSLVPASRLRGQPFPATKDVMIEGSSLFWGGLVRIDVVKVLPRTRLTFYGPKRLKINMVSINEADEFYDREVGITLIPPSSREKTEGWPGLQAVRELQISYTDRSRPACDIAISGLGWIAVEPDGFPEESSNSPDDGSGELHITVHVPKPVEVFVRPPLPVGKAAPRWYQYEELTEKEEELRPKWFY